MVHAGAADHMDVELASARSRDECRAQFGAEPLDRLEALYGTMPFIRHGAVGRHGAYRVRSPLVGAEPLVGTEPIGCGAL